MADLLDFFILVVIVSASGALSPGPLFLATINSAIKSGKYSGFAIALGHTSFELPLVVAMGLGVSNFLDNPFLRTVIGSIGALALIAFGVLQLTSSIKDLSKKSNGNAAQRSLNSSIKGSGLLAAFLVGLIFTAFNPYFLMWWFTVGLSLVSEAVKIGALTGILIMFAFHIWLDCAWLGSVGYAAAAGGKILKARYLALISLSLAILIIILGIDRLRLAVTTL